MIDKVILFCMVSGFAAAVSVHGVRAGGITVTVANILLMLGSLLVLCRRIMKDKPVWPSQLWAIPVVKACTVYCIVGLISGIFAEDKTLFMKDIIQKVSIVLFPFYLFTMGPRSARDLKAVFLVFLPIGVILSFVTLSPALSSRFEIPSFAMGMHKNQIGGCCGTFAIVAISAMLTTVNWKRRLVYVVLTGIALMGVVAAQSRAALLGIVLGTLFIMIANKSKPKHIVLFALINAIGLFALYKLLPEKAIQHVMTTEKNSANGIRIMVWTALWPKLLADPFAMRGWGNTFYTPDGWHFKDGASVLFADWIALGVAGPILIIAIIVTSIWLPLQNARRVKPNTALAFLNYAAMGLLIVRWSSAILDTFWIGRGVTLFTWMGIGTTVFIKLILDQQDKDRANMALRSSARQPALARK
jgi:hypothetical protein